MTKKWLNGIIACLILGVLWGANACNSSEKETGTDEAVTSLQADYDTLLISKEWGNCSGGDQGCITLAVSLPHFTGTNAPEINPIIEQLILGNYRDSFSTLETYLDYIIQDYQQALNADSLLMGWQVEHEVIVEWIDSQIISLRHEYFDNRGGAHPDLGLNMRSYDLKSMKRLVLNQLFEGDFDVALTEIGRKYLRLSLETNLSLSNDPKEIESLVSRFVPSDLFLLNAEGIQFYLPVEDMNQVVMDWVIFTIPYEVLVSGLPINPQGPISYLHQKNSRANS